MRDGGALARVASASPGGDEWKLSSSATGLVMISLQIITMVVCILLLAMFLERIPGASALPIDSTASLHELCRSSSKCAVRWYLNISSPIPSDYERVAFAYLLKRFTMERIGSADIAAAPLYQTTTLLAQAAANNSDLGAALDALQESWWLLLMQSARFCDGLANRAFELGKGCVCVAGANCNEGDAISSTWQYTGFTLLTSLFMVITLYMIYTTSEQNLGVRRLLSHVVNLYNYVRSRGAPPTGAVRVSTTTTIIGG